MKIIVKESNSEKITDAIRDAEGRATARTITAQNVIDTARKITRRLGIPKKYMIGITASVDYHAQNFPNAYKYTPESTQFRMIYTASGWALTSISRETTRRPSRAVDIFLTDDARAMIILNASHMASCEI